MKTPRLNRAVEDLLAFAETCERDEHTDTGTVHELIDQLRDAYRPHPPKLSELRERIETIEDVQGRHRDELDQLSGTKAGAMRLAQLEKRNTEQLRILDERLSRHEAHVKHSIGADVQQLQQQSTGHEQAQRAHDERLDSQALTLSSQSFQLDRHQKEIEELRARVQLLIDHAARAEPPAEVS